MKQLVYILFIKLFFIFYFEYIDQHDYTVKEIPKRENVPTQTERKTLKFEGETLYKTDYIAHELSPQPKRQRDKLQQLAEDRDFLTVNHKDFTEKEIKVCPCVYLPRPPNYDEEYIYIHILLFYIIVFCIVQKPGKMIMYIII